jgi:hypothetical protein
MFNVHQLLYRFDRPFFKLAAALNPEPLNPEPLNPEPLIFNRLVP